MSAALKVIVPFRNWPYYGRVFGPEVSCEMWLDQRIKVATNNNGHQHSALGHEMFALYRYADECPHADPDEEERFEAYLEVLDTVEGEPYDTWMARRNALAATLTEHADYLMAEDVWDNVHGGYSQICHDMPDGFACRECTEGDEDSGYEDQGCSRMENAKEAFAEFWWANGDADNRKTEMKVAE